MPPMLLLSMSVYTVACKAFSGCSSWAHCGIKR